MAVGSLVLLTAALGLAIAQEELFKDRPKFDYDPSGDAGPPVWHRFYSTCRGGLQSPINLEPAEAERVEMEPFRLTGYEEEISGLFLRDEGHDAHFDVAKDLEEARRRNVFIAGGGLNGSYWLHSVHFHWGSDNSEGSEHRIAGLANPVEAHLVHVSDKYFKIKEALADPAGLAVFGVFFQPPPRPETHSAAAASEGGTNGFPLAPLRAAGLGIGSAQPITDFRLRDLLPANLKTFYRYAGSLTTPPCSEAVQWSVFAQPLHVSEAKLAVFRSLPLLRANDGYDERNYRPLQARKGRRVLLTQ